GTSMPDSEGESMLLHHLRPAAAGTPTRCAARRPRALRYAYGSIMKLLAAIAILCSFHVQATENKPLCQHRELRIEPDMQMKETVFTKVNAKSAKAALERLDSNSNDLLALFAIENNRRIVRGYKLRARALESGEKDDIESFCDFYVSEAFYHD
ncbi:hypothetical protein, partial [Arsukibacterium sp.]|uniref:hypothetical protein n=1 Tax=Arsukibacterium sp. TaxID=1977258 RepID=UPI001BD2B2E9